MAVCHASVYGDSGDIGIFHSHNIIKCISHRGQLMVTQEEHKRRHDELHKALDELAADFICHMGKTLGGTPILELMEWSYQQTIAPTVKPTIPTIAGPDPDDDAFPPFPPFLGIRTG